VLPDLWEPFRAHCADYFGNIIAGYGRATSGKLEGFVLFINANPPRPPVVAPPLRYSHRRENDFVIRYATVPGLRYRLHGGARINSLAPLGDWMAGLGLDQQFIASSAVTGGANAYFFRLEVASQ
jgi:hypothetical protein